MRINSTFSIKFFFKSKRLRWFGAGAAVGLLLATGLIIRQPREPGMSPIEGYYTPNVQYGPWFLANYKRLFAASGEIPLVSNYTSGLSYGAVDFTQTYLLGVAFILSGVSDINEIEYLYRWTPWLGLILLPLAAIAMYSRFVKTFNMSFSPLAIVILYAFSTFPNYPIIVWSISGGYQSPLGWAMFFAIYLLILLNTLEKRFVLQWTILLVMIIFLIQPTYHTIALAIFIIVGIIWLTQRMIHKNYLTSYLFLITTIAFFAFLIYHATITFNGYGNILSNFVNDFYRITDKELLRYSLQIHTSSIWWHVINYSAVLLPVLWSGIILFKRKFISTKDTDVIYYSWLWIFSLIPMIILFFAWGGIFSTYERILQFGTLLSIAIVAYLLATRSNTLIPLAIVASICVFITVKLVDSFNVASSDLITDDEETAIEWIIDKTHCNTVIFTDFRIGSTLGYWNCFSVVGPSAKPLIANGQLNILTSLLYDGDGSKLSKAIDTITTIKGQRPEIILMSRRFLDPDIGFLTPDSRMKQIPELQWSTYKKLDGWKVEYENNTTMVLFRNSYSKTYKIH